LFSVKPSACVVAALLALHGIGFAQSFSRAGSIGIATAQPIDLRLNAFQSGESVTEQATGAAKAPAVAPAGNQLPLVTLGKDYRVGPNDLIDVEVFEMDNLKRTVRVNAAGAVSLPLIGQVVVAGLTSQEVEQRIAARYSEKYLQNPQVSVFIREFTTERITIEGAIAHPGIFPLAGKLTLLRALAMAGGFGPIANTSEVVLYRTNDKNERETAVYDVEKIRAGKAEDPPIHGDDLIVVQRDSVRVLLKDSVFRDIVDSVNPFSVLVPKP
jgi:polysaccharide biosynthesis/export protein